MFVITLELKQKIHAHSIFMVTEQCSIAIRERRAALKKLKSDANISNHIVNTDKVQQCSVDTLKQSKIIF